MITIVTIIQIRTIGISPKRPRSRGLTFFSSLLSSSAELSSVGFTEKGGVGGDVYSTSPSLRSTILRRERFVQRFSSGSKIVWLKLFKGDIY